MHRLLLLPLAVFFATASALAAQEVELLDFTSDSCPACVQMEPVLRNLAATGVPVRRVDVNREPNLASRFQIEYLPTFVAVVDGREVDRQVGATSPDRLKQMLQQARAAATPPRTLGQGRLNPESPTQQIAAPGPSQPRRNASDQRRERETLGQGKSLALNSQLSTLDSQPTTLDSRLIGSSVRLRVEDPQGVSYGTGTIISTRRGEAIVITCGHLFRESQGRSPVRVELFEADASSPRVAEVVDGEVLGFDLTRDLGVVRIRPNRPVQATPLAVRDADFQPGDAAASVGCDHGNDPTVWHTQLTAINRYVGPANVEAARTPVQGRSGGGLFNARGELIGVCFAADDQGNEGLYVGLPAIYEQLDELQLTSLTTAPPPSAMAVAQVSPGESRTGWEDRPFEMGVGVGRDVVPVAPPAGMAATTDATSLTAEERAALDEIGQRSGGGEVIVIIRPQAPGDRCEIFSLTNPSQEFLSQVTSLGQQATQARFTTQKQPRRTSLSERQADASQTEQKPPRTSRRPTTEWTAVPSRH